MNKKQIILLISASLIVFAVCSKKKDAPQSAGIDVPEPSGGVYVDSADVAKKNYYLIFDGSGSMRGKKLEVAKEAVKRFIKMIPEGANIGLTAFDANDNSERAPLGSSKDDLVLKVDEIKAGGGTPLGASINIAYAKILEQEKKQRGYGEYNLVIITDGQATDQTKMAGAVEKVLRKRSFVIHTIGFQIGTGHPLNQPGKIYYKTAENFDELSKGLESVLAESEDYTVTEFKKE